MEKKKRKCVRKKGSQPSCPGCGKMLYTAGTSGIAAGLCRYYYCDKCGGEYRRIGDGDVQEMLPMKGTAKDEEARMKRNLDAIKPPTEWEYKYCQGGRRKGEWNSI